MRGWREAPILAAAVDAISSVMELLPHRYCMHSYSQSGEDVILARTVFVQDEKRYGKGFYVDVGAHHAKRLSNTYHFYRRGWRGINIDAAPGSMASFRRWRPRDLNLEVGVSRERASMRFYLFRSPAFNTFSETAAHKWEAEMPGSLLGTVEVPTVPLRELLDRHMPPGGEIDLMNVDVEGLDLEVLQSNDWDRYRPTVLLVEASDSPDDPDGQAVYRFLQGIGYRAVTSTKLTTIFERL